MRMPINLLLIMLRVMVYVGALIGSIVLFLRFGDHFAFFHSDSFFFGLDFLPPLWLTAATLPFLVLLFAYRHHILGGAVLGVFVLHLLFMEDLSFRFLFRSPDVVTTDKTLSVLALNVRYYSFGLDSVASAIRQADADVVLLSENVLDSTRTARLTAALPDYRLLAGRQEETAILSKLPVVKWQEVELPSRQASLRGKNHLADTLGRHHRSFIHAVVQKHNQQVHAISLRLIAGRAADKSLAGQFTWGKYLLSQQVRETRFFRDYLATLEGPVIFGGDLNATPSSKIVRMIGRGMKDSFMEDHIYGRYTFRVKMPTTRLDYIFASPDLRPLDSRVIPVAVSDHFPLYANFLLPSPGVAAAEIPTQLDSSHGQNASLEHPL